jgi:glyoxylase I family protein
MPELSFWGIHHVALNVHDLEESVHWYSDILGFAPLFPFDTDDFERRLVRHPSGIVIGLTKHRHADAEAPANERQTGLDHLAFAVNNVDELQAWAQHFTEAGVTHSGITVTPTAGSALIAFRDPNNIQLEMYVAQGATAK